jgi:hypothetical protein
VLAGVWIIGEYGDVLIEGGLFEYEDTQMEVKKKNTSRTF